MDTKHFFTKNCPGISQCVSSSDCVICTKEKLEDAGLSVLGVVEGLSYHPDESIVKIHLIFAFKNEGPKEVRCRIVHRGTATAWLKKYSFTTDCDERQKILSKLLRERIVHNPTNENTVLFHRRVNGFSLVEKGLELSIAGPGHCFDVCNMDSIELIPELGQNDQGHRSFTSYIIPHPEAPGISPGEASICILKLELHPDSYERLVGTGQCMSIDSYARIMRDIEIYELPYEKSNALVELYEKRIRPQKAIIEPDSYDIVIFQKLGQKVEVKDKSISITEIKSSLREMSEDILFFAGQPDDFCLSIKYPDSVVNREKKKREVISLT